MFSIVFEPAFSGNLISPSFGEGIEVPPAPLASPAIPAPAVRPGRSAPYWDNDRGEWVDPISPADREWWTSETFRDEIERADREQAMHDAWIERQAFEWEHRERAFDEALMGRV